MAEQLRNLPPEPERKQEDSDGPRHFQVIFRTPDAGSGFLPLNIYLQTVDEHMARRETERHINENYSAFPEGVRRRMKESIHLENITEREYKKRIASLEGAIRHGQNM